MKRLLRAVPTGVGTATLAIALALATPALAGKRGVNPEIVEDALAYTLTDRTKSARLLEDAIAHNEGFTDKERLQVLLMAGEQRRLLGDYSHAREWFEKVIAEDPKAWEATSATLGLALVQAINGLDRAVLDTFETVKDKDGLDTMNADRYLILTVQAARRGDAAEAQTLSSKAVAFAAADRKVSERVQAHVAALTDESANAVEYVRVVKDPEPEDTLLPVSDLDMAEEALREGDYDTVRALAATIAASEADDDVKLAAAYLDKRIHAVPVRPGRIGVLLPLSEKYEAAGRQVQAAFDLGWADGKGKGELVYVDSGATPESAVAALEALVLEQGVVAVVGPLLTDVADAVASAAQALRVPLISLSQGLEPNPEHEWVFQAMVTPLDQVDALVDYTMGQKGMRAFAVFAPDSNYGHAAAEAFEASVVERGGKVTISEFYDAAATDLIEFAKALGRKDYSARRREFEELRAQAKERGGNPDKVVLPPTIDFDALFLPDNASRVPLAAAALAYEEFPLGTFRTSRDGATLPMLGLSGWNKDSLISQGGPYVQGAVFTDAFWADDATDFVARFQEAVGQSPTALAAVTVDAGRLVAAATQERPATRAAFATALLDLDDVPSVTGASGFDPERRKALRQIRLLTIVEDRIEPVDPQVPPEQ